MDTNEFNMNIRRDNKDRQIAALKEWIKAIRYEIDEATMKCCGLTSYEGMSKEQHMRIAYYCEQALNGKSLV